MFKLLSTLALFSFLQIGHADESIAIASCTDLQSMGANLKADYHLIEDINCTGFDFTPIKGTFSGTLSGNKADGGVYAIRHLMITAGSGKDKKGGLFENTQGATISDLAFENVMVLSDDDTHRGLLAGDMKGTTVSDITGKDIIIAGDTTNDSLWNVSGFAGGLAGLAVDSKILHVRLLNIAIKQHTFAGGFFGVAYGVGIENSSVTGLLPIQEGQRTEPYPEDMVFGGLVGDAGDNVSIMQSSAAGFVSSPYHSGGLVGMLEGDNLLIKNSYARVLVGSFSFSGGLIGRIRFGSATLDHVYAAGEVVAIDNGRGLIGAENRDGDFGSKVGVIEAYFDKQLAQRKYAGVEGGEGKSTKEMTKQHDKTFPESKRWSRDVWVFKNGEYPALKGE